MAQLIINHDQCIQCGLCVAQCPFSAMSMDNGKVETNAACKMCRICVRNCPVGAIKKDETDTELCIQLSQKLKAKEIDLIGALGGRIDHTIANINLLYYIRKRGINNTYNFSICIIFITKST